MATFIRWSGFGICGLLIGLGIGYFFFYMPLFADNQTLERVVERSVAPKQVIGFLPFWLLSKAQTDYSPYINTLTYFGLTVDGDGSILKETDPGESEPGWYTLKSGKVDPYLQSARNNGVKLSLLMFAGKPDSINQLVSDPINHANTLIDQVKPIMQSQKFVDLNLDIESTREASDAARVQFSQFVKQVRQKMQENSLGTLSLEIAPDMLVKKGLIDPALIKDDIDHLILMTYDYHYVGSQVTGPVAPLLGAGSISEFDVDSAVELALAKVPSEKIVLGVPLYGYQWETLRDATRSATIPSSGVSISTKTIQEKLQNCSSCQVQTDQLAGEKYLIYPDADTGTFFQAFYPDKDSTQAKIDFAKQKNLGGLALWALGYEGGDVLDPVKSY